jgi:lipid II:glycine glycyltransferase (peptidoglycan interpeptide bridge formation enzyme)
MAELSPAEWDEFLSRCKNPHILQTTPWGQLKADFGWKVLRFSDKDCGAQILIKRILPGINFAYIPKGPIGCNEVNLWAEIDTLCHANQCVFLKVEPDGWEYGEPSTVENHLKSAAQFVHSQHSIQPVRTLVVDTSGEVTQILARMKQKTRYNISLAQKNNVIVKPYLELDAFYKLMQVTGNRDQFGIHSQLYYKKAFDLFHTRNLCQLLVAEFENQAIAALMVFRSGSRAWYFYGASSDLHRKMMPNYLLQWEAMLWAKSQGCQEYDLWGVPDADLDVLEANFTNRNDGLWGVYRFKRGFGGELRRSPGTWDRIYNPFLYRLYSVWLKYRKIQG